MIELLVAFKVEYIGRFDQFCKVVSAGRSPTARLSAIFFPESLFFGSFYFNSNQIFRIYRFLQPAERILLRSHIQSCVSSNLAADPTIFLLGEYIKIIFENFTISKFYDIIYSPIIDDFLIGNEELQLRPNYRPHNIVCDNAYLLEFLAREKIIAKSQYCSGIASYVSSETPKLDAVESLGAFLIESDFVSPTSKSNIRREVEQARAINFHHQLAKSPFLRALDQLEMPSDMKLDDNEIYLLRQFSEEDFLGPCISLIKSLVAKGDRNRLDFWILVCSALGFGGILSQVDGVPPFDLVSTEDMNEMHLILQSRGINIKSYNTTS